MNDQTTPPAETGTEPAIPTLRIHVFLPGVEEPIRLVTSHALVVVAEHTTGTAPGVEDVIADPRHHGYTPVFATRSDLPTTREAQVRGLINAAREAADRETLAIREAEDRAARMGRAN